MTVRMKDRTPERLLALQRQFAGHLRDPDGVEPPPGLEDRRLAVYRRLFFNNLRKLLAANFPVLRKLHDDWQWDRLIRDFMIHHRPQTPLFTEIGGELVAHLARRAEQRHCEDPPWLVELAQWEFLETTVRLAEDDLDRFDAQRIGDLLAKHPVINPTVRLAEFQWPVHRIGPDFRPEHPEPVVLAVYRRRNDRVAFMKLNALTAQLIVELVDDAKQSTGREALLSLARRLNLAQDAVLENGAEMLAALRDKELIIGSEALA